ncbi:hypothetical protein Tco_1133844 [Tanacetum coccineum]
MWKDDLRLRLSSSLGPSTPPSSYPGPSTRLSYYSEPSGSTPSHGEAECLNCKFLAEMIKTLEAKIKILEGTLEMKGIPRITYLSQLQYFMSFILTWEDLGWSSFHLAFGTMPRDDPIIERIPRRSLKKRNITPSKNELPHISSNVAFEENMICRFNTDIARRTRDGQNIHTMMKLSKLLHIKGFHISFVNTHFNHNRLLRSRGTSSLDGLSDFRFYSIQDGLPPSQAEATQSVTDHCESLPKHSLEPFCELITRLNGDEEPDVPPVSCIISDGCMSFTLEAAEIFGLPEVLFWTTSACGLLAYTHYRDLIKKGYTPLKGLTNLPIDDTLLFDFEVFFEWCYHKLDSYRILQVTYQEPGLMFGSSRFPSSCEILCINQMFWQDLKDNALGLCVTTCELTDLCTLVLVISAAGADATYSILTISDDSGPSDVLGINRECWTGLHEMAMAAFESQYIARVIRIEKAVSSKTVVVRDTRDHVNGVLKSGSIETFGESLGYQELESHHHHALGAF